MTNSYLVGLHQQIAGLFDFQDAVDIGGRTDRGERRWSGERTVSIRLARS